MTKRITVSRPISSHWTISSHCISDPACAIKVIDSPNLKAGQARREQRSSRLFTCKILPDVQCPSEQRPLCRRARRQSFQDAARGWRAQDQVGTILDEIGRIAYILEHCQAQQCQRTRAFGRRSSVRMRALLLVAALAVLVSGAASLGAEGGENHSISLVQHRELAVWSWQEETGVVNDRRMSMCPAASSFGRLQKLELVAYLWSSNQSSRLVGSWDCQSSTM